MTLIVETGTFDPTANSYASVAEADARHSVSIAADTWENFDLPVKEQRLITATRRLDIVFDWMGQPYHPDQPLGFPRRNLRDATGSLIYMRRVPMMVKQATIDLALWLSEDVTAAGSTAEDVIEEISLGPIGIKMAIPDTAAAAVRPLVPSEIVMMLRNFGQFVGGNGGSVGRLIR